MSYVEDVKVCVKELRDTLYVADTVSLDSDDGIDVVCSRISDAVEYASDIEDHFTDVCDVLRQDVVEIHAPYERLKDMWPLVPKENLPSIFIDNMEDLFSAIEDIVDDFHDVVK